MEDVLVLKNKNYVTDYSRVLILVVVEDVLVLGGGGHVLIAGNVLILVVVEDVLVHDVVKLYDNTLHSLNPCCSGRCSSTELYKTKLIINKLKNSTKQIFTFLNRKLTIS